MSVSRRRVIVVAAVLAAVAANYWLLEGALASRTDPAGSWISDLGARSEPDGWRFDLLDALAGIPVLVLAVALVPLARGDRLLRWGLVALFATGVCSMLDGALPFSCAETLSPSCELDYDAIDVAHTTETLLAVVATLMAFALIGLALRRRPDLRATGNATLVIGALWAGLNLLMAASYAVDALDDVKGVLHRSSQAVLGVWLLTLGLGVVASWRSAPSADAFGAKRH